MSPGSELASNVGELASPKLMGHDAPTRPGGAEQVACSFDNAAVSIGHVAVALRVLPGMRISFTADSEALK